MPALISLPPWPVNPYNCAHLTLDGMSGITQLPDLPPTCIGMRLKDLPNLHCLPPLPNNLVDLFIEGSTPITCLPNDFDENVSALPICGVLDSCDHLATAITGRVYWDQNTNGAFDAGDTPFPLATVWSMPSTFGTGPDNNGMYWMSPVPGNYTVQALWASPYVTAIDPAVHTVGIPNITSVDSLNDFALEIIPGIQDLLVDVVRSPSVPGFTGNVWINVANIGSTGVSGSVQFDFGTVQTWAGSTPPPDVLAVDHAIWNFTNLPMAGTLGMHILVHTDSTVAVGTPFTWTVTADPVSTDQTPLDNQWSASDVVVASYDPNDKQVAPDTLSSAQVMAEARLTYTIRFQNTGTFLAERVVITDTLSTDLQWNTMQLVAASHAHEWYISNGVLHIVFDNIMLPDSNSNEPESHGFFKFSMKPVSTLLLGDQVDNTANIYFDFNEPVITNTATMLVNNNVSVAPQDDPRLRAYPNPVGDALVLTGTGITTGTSIVISDAMGREVLRASATGQRTQLDIAGLKSGVYTVRTGAGAMLRVVKR